MSDARSEYTDFQRLAPDAFEVVSSLGKVAARAGLDKQLLELIKLRASQINGCGAAYRWTPPARRSTASAAASSNRL